ncbi:MAG: hypothetical protein H6Q59_3457, partial [Firmicutes bacterium]|nr:hypothetical protein [Bacillota bacterium]
MLKKRGRNFIAMLLILVIVIGLMPAETANAVTGDTYDFGGLAATPSGGYYTLGDKFKVGNDTGGSFAPWNSAAGGVNNAFYPTDDAAVNEDSTSLNPYTVIFKAEGGSVCKTFTFHNLGLSSYSYADILANDNNFFSYIKITFYNALGTEISNNKVITDTRSITNTEITQLSDIMGLSAWNIDGVAAVKLEFVFYCSGNTHATNLLFENITVSNISTFVNTPPTFKDAGDGSLTVNQDAGATGINSLLHANDTDSGQTLTWTVDAVPAHGSLSSFASVTGGSGTNDITPSGTLTYTPTAGYSGSDSFTIRVSDGTASVTRTINVTVTPAPSSDATLKAAVTVKGQSVTSLGTPNATLGSEAAGAVTITAAKAADTSNAG